MAENPVYTDAGAFRTPIPAAPRPVDRSPVYGGLGRVGEALERLGTVLYQQDQQARVLWAQVGMAKGFQALRQRTAAETDWEKIQETFAEGSTRIQAEFLGSARDDRTREAIAIEFEREALTAQAHLTADVLRKKAEADLAGMTERLGQLEQAALEYPDHDLTSLKEQADALYAGRVAAGTLPKDRAAAMLLSTRQRLDEIKATALVMGNPAGAEIMLQERERGADNAYTNFTDLDPLKRLALTDKAHAGAAQRDANVDELGRQGVFAVLTGQSDGDAQVRAIAKAGATARQLDNWGGRIRAAGVARSFLDRISTAGPAEASRLIGEFSAKAVDVADPYMVTAVEPFHEELRAMEQHWRSDPAKAADLYFPLKQLPDGAPGVTMAQRIAQRTAAFKVKELPLGTHVLTKDEEFRAIASFKAAPVDQRPPLARNLVMSYGPYAAEAVTQLLDKGLQWEFLPMSEPSISPYAAAQLSASMQLSIEDLRKTYAESEEATAIQSAALEAFREGYGLSLPAGEPKQIVELGQVTAKLALHLRSADKAYAALWGQFPLKTVDGGATQVRFPPGTPEQEQEMVVTTAADILRNIDLRNLLTDLPDPATLSQHLHEFGGWITYSGPDGSDAGIVLTLYGRPVLTKAGNKVQLTWREALQYKPPDRLTPAQRAVATPSSGVRERLLEDLRLREAGERAARLRREAIDRRGVRRE